MYTNYIKFAYTSCSLWFVYTVCAGLSMYVLRSAGHDACLNCRGRVSRDEVIEWMFSVLRADLEGNPPTPRRGTSCLRCAASTQLPLRASGCILTIRYGSGWGIPIALYHHRVGIGIGTSCVAFGEVVYRYRGGWPHGRAVVREDVPGRGPGQAVGLGLLGALRRAEGPLRGRGGRQGGRRGGPGVLPRLLQGAQRRARPLGGRSRPGPLSADPPGGLARARDAGGGHGNRR